MLLLKVNYKGNNMEPIIANLHVFALNMLIYLYSPYST